MGGGKHIRKTDSKSAAVLATVKGKSLRDGLRPPLTAAARSGQRKLGWDEEMVAVRSNKEMVKNSSLDTNRPIQVTDRAGDRISLGRRTIRSTAGAGGRTGS